MNNQNLYNAKTAKNDEFYTQLSDIEKELSHYKEHLKGKIVYCNCDDPTFSNFWKYLHTNFGILKLKKIISTHYSKESPPYKMEYSGGNDLDCSIGLKTPLIGDGDFRSQECIEVLKQSDVVVTNPPFSLFRDYVVQLIKYDKKFIIIGSILGLTYKGILTFVKNNEVRLGYHRLRDFIQKDGTIKGIHVARWLTNFSISKKQEHLNLTEIYTPEKYPKYDNYDAINVDKTSEIPKDYFGVMGVPVTFLDKYSPDQFEIIGSNNVLPIKCLTLSGKELFKRIIIKRKIVTTAP